MIADKAAVSRHLAERLKAARQAEGLSLEALSHRSGVSTSMISQVERGASNPTVAIIWSLTKALNIEFSGLFEDEERRQSPIREVVRAGEAPVISSHGSGCRIRILSPPESVGETEIYDLDFNAGGCLDSAPHRSGCTESLLVIEGEIRVTSDGVSEDVRPGDTIRYAADRLHAITAGATPARAILIVSGA